MNLEELLEEDGFLEEEEEPEDDDDDDDDIDALLDAVSDPSESAQENILERERESVHSTPSNSSQHPILIHGKPSMILSNSHFNSELQIADSPSPSGQEPTDVKSKKSVALSNSHFNSELQIAESPSPSGQEPTDVKSKKSVALSNSRFSSEQRIVDTSSPPSQHPTEVRGKASVVLSNSHFSPEQHDHYVAVVETAEHLLREAKNNRSGSSGTAVVDIPALLPALEYQREIDAQPLLHNNRMENGEETHIDADATKPTARPQLRRSLNASRDGDVPQHTRDLPEHPPERSTTMEQEVPGMSIKKKSRKKKKSNGKETDAGGARETKISSSSVDTAPPPSGPSSGILVPILPDHTNRPRKTSDNSATDGSARVPHKSMPPPGGVELYTSVPNKVLPPTEDPMTHSVKQLIRRHGSASAQKVRQRLQDLSKEQNGEGNMYTVVVDNELVSVMEGNFSSELAGSTSVSYSRVGVEYVPNTNSSPMASVIGAPNFGTDDYSEDISAKKQSQVGVPYLRSGKKGSSVVHQVLPGRGSESSIRLQEVDEWLRKKKVRIPSAENAVSDNEESNDVQRDYSAPFLEHSHSWHNGEEGEEADEMLDGSETRRPERNKAQKDAVSSNDAVVEEVEGVKGENNATREPSEDSTGTESLSDHFRDHLNAAKAREAAAKKAEQEALKRQRRQQKQQSQHQKNNDKNGRFSSQTTPELQTSNTAANRQDPGRDTPDGWSRHSTPLQKQQEHISRAHPRPSVGAGSQPFGDPRGVPDASNEYRTEDEERVESNTDNKGKNSKKNPVVQSHPDRKISRSPLRKNSNDQYGEEPGREKVVRNQEGYQSGEASDKLDHVTSPLANRRTKVQPYLRENSERETPYSHIESSTSSGSSDESKHIQENRHRRDGCERRGKTNHHSPVEDKSNRMQDGEPNSSNTDRHKKREHDGRELGRNRNEDRQKGHANRKQNEKSKYPSSEDSRPSSSSAERGSEDNHRQLAVDKDDRKSDLKELQEKRHPPRGRERVIGKSSTVEKNSPHSRGDNAVYENNLSSPLSKGYPQGDSHPSHPRSKETSGKGNTSSPRYYRDDRRYNDEDIDNAGQSGSVSFRSHHAGHEESNRRQREERPYGAHINERSKPTSDRAMHRDPDPAMPRNNRSGRNDQGGRDDENPRGGSGHHLNQRYSHSEYRDSPTPSSDDGRWRYSSHQSPKEQVSNRPHSYGADPPRSQFSPISARREEGGNGKVGHADSHRATPEEQASDLRDRVRRLEQQSKCLLDNDEDHGQHIRLMRREMKEIVHELMEMENEINVQSLMHSARTKPSHSHRDPYSCRNSGRDSRDVHQSSRADKEERSRKKSADKKDNVSPRKNRRSSVSTKGSSDSSDSSSSHEYSNSDRKRLFGEADRQKGRSESKNGSSSTSRRRRLRADYQEHHRKSDRSSSSSSSERSKSPPRSKRSRSKGSGRRETLEDHQHNGMNPNSPYPSTANGVVWSGPAPDVVSQPPSWAGNFAAPPQTPSVLVGQTDGTTIILDGQYYYTPESVSPGMYATPMPYISIQLSAPLSSRDVKLAAEDEELGGGLEGRNTRNSSHRSSFPRKSSNNIPSPGLFTPEQLQQLSEFIDQEYERKSKERVEVAVQETTANPGNTNNNKVHHSVSEILTEDPLTSVVKDPIASSWIRSQSDEGIALLRADIEKLRTAMQAQASNPALIMPVNTVGVPHLPLPADGAAAISNPGMSMWRMLQALLSGRMNRNDSDDGDDDMGEASLSSSYFSLNSSVGFRMADGGVGEILAHATPSSRKRKAKLTARKGTGENGLYQQRVREILREIQEELSQAKQQSQQAWRNLQERIERDHQNHEKDLSELSKKQKQQQKQHKQQIEAAVASAAATAPYVPPASVHAYHGSSPPSLFVYGSNDFVNNGGDSQGLPSKRKVAAKSDNSLAPGDSVTAGRGSGMLFNPHPSTPMIVAQPSHSSEIQEGVYVSRGSLKNPYSAEETSGAQSSPLRSNSGVQKPAYPERSSSRLQEQNSSEQQLRQSNHDGIRSQGSIRGNTIDEQDKSILLDLQRLMEEVTQRVGVMEEVLLSNPIALAPEHSGRRSTQRMKSPHMAGDRSSTSLSGCGSTNPGHHSSSQYNVDPSQRPSSSASKTASPSPIDRSSSNNSRSSPLSMPQRKNVRQKRSGNSSQGAALSHEMGSGEVEDGTGVSISPSNTYLRPVPDWDNASLTKVTSSPEIDHDVSETEEFPSNGKIQQGGEDGSRDREEQGSGTIDMPPLAEDQYPYCLSGHTSEERRRRSRSNSPYSGVIPTTVKEAMQMIEDVKKRMASAHEEKQKRRQRRQEQKQMENEKGGNDPYGSSVSSSPERTARAMYKLEELQKMLERLQEEQNNKESEQESKQEDQELDKRHKKAKRNPYVEYEEANDGDHPGRDPTGIGEWQRGNSNGPQSGRSNKEEEADGQPSSPTDPKLLSVLTRPSAHENRPSAHENRPPHPPPSDTPKHFVEGPLRSHVPIKKIVVGGPNRQHIQNPRPQHPYHPNDFPGDLLPSQNISASVESSVLPLQHSVHDPEKSHVLNTRYGGLSTSNNPSSFYSAMNHNLENVHHLVSITSAPPNHGDFNSPLYGGKKSKTPNNTISNTSAFDNSKSNVADPSHGSGRPTMNPVLNFPYKNPYSRIEPLPPPPSGGFEQFYGPTGELYSVNHTYSSYTADDKSGAQKTSPGFQNSSSGGPDSGAVGSAATMPAGMENMAAPPPTTVAAISASPSPNSANSGGGTPPFCFPTQTAAPERRSSQLQPLENEDEIQAALRQLQEIEARRRHLAEMEAAQQDMLEAAQARQRESAIAEKLRLVEVLQTLERDLLKEQLKAETARKEIMRLRDGVANSIRDGESRKKACSQHTEDCLRGLQDTLDNLLKRVEVQKRDTQIALQQKWDEMRALADDSDEKKRHLERKKARTHQKMEEERRNLAAKREIEIVPIVDEMRRVQREIAERCASIAATQQEVSQLHRRSAEDVQRREQPFHEEIEVLRQRIQSQQKMMEQLPVDYDALQHRAREGHQLEQDAIIKEIRRLQEELEAVKSGEVIQANSYTPQSGRSLLGEPYSSALPSGVVEGDTIFSLTNVPLLAKSARGKTAETLQEELLFKQQLLDSKRQLYRDEQRQLQQRFNQQLEAVEHSFATLRKEETELQEKIVNVRQRVRNDTMREEQRLSDILNRLEQDVEALRRRQASRQLQLDRVLQQYKDADSAQLAREKREMEAADDEIMRLCRASAQTTQALQEECTRMEEDSHRQNHLIKEEIVRVEESMKQAKEDLLRQLRRQDEMTHEEVAQARTKELVAQQDMCSAQNRQESIRLQIVQCKEQLRRIEQKLLDEQRLQEYLMKERRRKEKEDAKRSKEQGEKQKALVNAAERMRQRHNLIDHPLSSDNGSTSDDLMGTTHSVDEVAEIMDPEAGLRTGSLSHNSIKSQSTNKGKRSSGGALPPLRAISACIESSSSSALSADEVPQEDQTTSTHNAISHQQRGTSPLPLPKTEQRATSSHIPLAQRSTSPLRVPSQHQRSTSSHPMNQPRSTSPPPPVSQAQRATSALYTQNQQGTSPPRSPPRYQRSTSSHQVKQPRSTSPPLGASQAQRATSSHYSQYQRGTSPMTRDQRNKEQQVLHLSSSKSGNAFTPRDGAKSSPQKSACISPRSGSESPMRISINRHDQILRTSSSFGSHSSFSSGRSSKGPAVPEKSTSSSPDPINHSVSPLPRQSSHRVLQPTHSTGASSTHSVPPTSVSAASSVGPRAAQVGMLPTHSLQEVDSTPSLGSSLLPRGNQFLDAYLSEQEQQRQESPPELERQPSYRRETMSPAQELRVNTLHSHHLLGLESVPSFLSEDPDPQRRIIPVLPKSWAIEGRTPPSTPPEDEEGVEEAIENVFQEECYSASPSSSHRPASSVRQISSVPSNLSAWQKSPSLLPPSLSRDGSEIVSQPPSSGRVVPEPAQETSAHSSAPRIAVPQVPPLQSSFSTPGVPVNAEGVIWVFPPQEPLQPPAPVPPLEDQPVWVRPVNSKGEDAVFSTSEETPSPST